MAGPFNSAWTLDSIFNANFIQTGLIKADIFQNSFNKTGDVLKLVNGLLQIWNNKKKIMELTKKEWNFGILRVQLERLEQLILLVILFLGLLLQPLLKIIFSYSYKWRRQIYFDFS